MSRLVWSALLVACWGCSGDDDRAPARGSGGSGGSSAAGAAGTPASGGSAGASPGSGGAAGQGGAYEPPETCGDGQLDPGEFCDGADLGGRSCRTYGFDDGELGCVRCQYDLAPCSGTERCSDGADNDGDGYADCADEDCAPGCEDACVAPTPLSDPATVTGDTLGQPNTYAASCAEPGSGTGAEVAYAFTAARSGLLELRLSGSLGLGLSVRDRCADADSERACEGRRRLRLPVEQGQELFVLVEGFTSSIAGPYTLYAGSRTVTCGDGFRDEGEACDDGDTSDGDGCSAACAIEPTETEPNAELEQASALSAPFFGTISGPDDEDLVAFTLGAGSYHVRAEVRDFGDGGCEYEEIDSVLTLLDASGAELVQNDDAGAGYCSQFISGELGPGTYYVRVARAPLAAVSSFGYVLDVELNRCGDGQPIQGEACDDGNNDVGDGCSPTCELESVQP